MRLYIDTTLPQNLVDVVLSDIKEQIFTKDECDMYLFVGGTVNEERIKGIKDKRPKVIFISVRLDDISVFKDLDVKHLFITDRKGIDLLKSELGCYKVHYLPDVNVLRNYQTKNIDRNIGIYINNVLFEKKLDKLGRRLRRKGYNLKLFHSLEDITSVNILITNDYESIVKGITMHINLIVLTGDRNVNALVEETGIDNDHTLSFQDGKECDLNITDLMDTIDTIKDSSLDCGRWLRRARRSYGRLVSKFGNKILRLVDPLPLDSLKSYRIHEELFGVPDSKYRSDIQEFLNSDLDEDMIKSEMATLSVPTLETIDIKAYTPREKYYLPFKLFASITNVYSCLSELMSYLGHFSRTKGVYLDVAVNHTFGRLLEHNLNSGLLPYTIEWIGFIHYTYRDLFDNEIFIRSLESCKRLYTFNFFLRDEIINKLDELNIDIDVEFLEFPGMKYSITTYDESVVNKDYVINQSIKFRTPLLIKPSDEAERLLGGDYPGFTDGDPIEIKEYLKTIDIRRYEPLSFMNRFHQSMS